MPRSISVLLTGFLILACPVASMADTGHRGFNTRPARARQASLHRLQRAEQLVEISTALSTAEAYWRAVPCDGNIVVTAGMALPTGMAADTDAWVTFGSSLGDDNLAAPASSYTACRIGIARWQWPTAATIRGDWGMFCLTITHEVGHLLGLPHSLVPGSVMAPVFVGESSVPELCRRHVPFHRAA
jgi:Matrixin